MEDNNIVPEKKNESQRAPQNAERLWAIFCHLSAMLMFVIPPVGNILGPLVIWLIKKNEMPFVDVEGKESLNFQISMTIYMFVAFILCFIAIGIPLMILIVATNVVLVIIASIKTSNDEKFHYPCTIRFIR